MATEDVECHSSDQVDLGLETDLFGAAAEILVSDGAVERRGGRGRGRG